MAKANVIPANTWLRRVQHRPSLFAIAILLGAGLGISGLASAQAATDHGLQVNRLPGLSDHRRTADTFSPSDVVTYHVYVPTIFYHSGALIYRTCLPFVSRPESCLPTGESYGVFEIPDWAPTPPAETHPDLNLGLRGYKLTREAYLGLIDIGGDTDSKAPQLAGLFATPRAPVLAAAYQVHNWDWTCNCRGAPIDDVEVSMADLAAAPGETIHVPDSGYGIGGGYEVTVLFASAERLTLKYTEEDNVRYGYTIHFENICVDPNLLALYQALNNAGRHQLPALRARQTVGRVLSSGRIGVVIRDTGAFMDPRSRKDWWHGY